METVCVAFKAHMGWVNAVAVPVAAPEPMPAHVERIELLGTEDPAVREPYHLAAGLHLERAARPADPAGVVRRGRRKQAQLTGKRLRAFCNELREQGLDFSRAVVLTGRGRLGHDLEEILGSHANIHVAEGEAIRDALRQALATLEIEYVNQDEKSLPREGEELLGSGYDDALKKRRPAGLRSWTREERLLCLGAWLNRAPHAESR